MDNKLAAVAQFPQPKTVENVRLFLGSEQGSSFKDLKHALTHAPVLVFPNFDDPFIIYTDASGVGIGGVLMQTDSAGKQHVIAFASRALTLAAKKIFSYSLRDKIQKGRQNVVADALSRNLCVGAVAEASPIPNFSMKDLYSAQREHHLWKKVIYALESGDETQLPELPISFLHFFLSHDETLCRYWAQKPVPIEQFVIPEKLVPTVLRLVHDVPISGRPGRDKTLAIIRKRYYWPKLRIDVESHVARCITCAQHKGVVKGPASILQYPLPEAPRDVVSIDLLQLPQNHHGSRYLLACVDHLTRFVTHAT